MNIKAYSWENREKKKKGRERDGDWRERENRNGIAYYICWSIYILSKRLPLLLLLLLLVKLEDDAKPQFLFIMFYYTIFYLF